MKAIPYVASCAFVSILAAQCEIPYIAREPMTSNGAPDTFFERPRTALSVDGRYFSFATGRTPQIQNEGVHPLFLRNNVNGQQETLNLTSIGRVADGTALPAAFSTDGRYVLMSTDVRTLDQSGLDNDSSDDIYLFDRVLRSHTLISVLPSGQHFARHYDFASMSGDTRFITFRGWERDLYPESAVSLVPRIILFDRDANEFIDASPRVRNPVSSASYIGEYSTDVSDDGSTVVYSGILDALVSEQGYPPRVYVFSRSTGTVDALRSASGVLANGDCVDAKVSGDGNVVLFRSFANNLLTQGLGNGRIVVFNRATQTYERISENNAGVNANDECWNANISNNGRYVAFLSSATNLAPDAPAGVTNAYVRDRVLRRTTLVSRSITGAPANGNCDRLSEPSDGGVVGFFSAATNLVADDSNGTLMDVFVVNPAAHVRILEQPSAQVSALGDAVMFSVTADVFGAVPSYQWYLDGAALQDGPEIVGAQSSQLQIAHVACGSRGEYSVRVSGVCEFNAISDTAQLSIFVTGDLNGDLRVDLYDLATLLTNFGRTAGTVLSTGDVDGDGRVNLTDLALLLQDFGRSCD